jgi:hypothetical protein
MLHWCLTQARWQQHHKTCGPRSLLAASTRIDTAFSLCVGTAEPHHLGANGGSNGDHSSYITKQQQLNSVTFLSHRQASYGRLLQL